ncbi:MAG: tRNA epoxyqueuosine(34) reductase QueG [Moraxellaceae bacterium]|nr:tRNA epoxyqueuosine(34) reductase QueG [Moraxellaceae bacterium]MBP7229672.1 tRNA epoxyqueuosine(34) reductase QueG [Moraxellaceae bacterium]MBP8852769.1 tRNA epoxyqueuosine(34) reductase QueG [Moraxellaceae bacterium]MBP9045827.1 tRNA epoxyqueuosine(34) reductase QueG [Moraxellaceae bacterium]MBP9730508.1 tRNA epoxyqueuosine(34) reductase QueG [Moraxellaceae bacterium]
MQQTPDSPDPVDSPSPNFEQLAADIKIWGRELGFQHVGISDVDLGEHPQRFAGWIARGFHADMEFLSRDIEKRTQPATLIPGTQRVIAVRMDYWPADTRPWEILRDGNRAYISRYALGRDYHRTIRKRLQKFADRIVEAVGDFGYRAFVDSAPVMEKPLAEKAGLGWMGKHTLIINRHAGSYFFLGELFTDLPLPVDAPVSSHCGSCSACIKICPTQAIVAPYQLDSRKCISWLTIEYDGVIPEELRAPIGNRVFGCDDCQLVCPWNRYARISPEKDFLPRHALDQASLRELFLWSEKQYLDATEGMALRRSRYPSFLRNMAVGLGNAPYDPAIIAALEQRLVDADEVLAEHIVWAIAQQRARAVVINTFTN